MQKLAPLPPMRPLGTPAPPPAAKAPRLASIVTSASGLTSASGSVQKERLTLDSEVQTLEDALCLVFLQLQLDELTDRVADNEKMVDVLKKSWRKMSPAGREFALGLELSDEGRELVRRALDG